MIRWSPMSSVFSMEPEGMTRAWPRVPLMSMKARMTQNQAMISLLTLALMEASASLGEAPFLVFSLIASAFTFHRYDLGRLSIGRGFTDFELHQVRRIVACVARRTKFAFGIVDGPLETREREVAEGIGAEILADLLGGVGGGD